MSSPYAVDDASIRSQLGVVGIGASAGGITALKEFFSRTPADAGLAWVVILHLSPDHESRLAEVLQITTVMPVTQVTARVRIQPDHVYVVPPNKSLEIVDDALTLAEITRPEQRRAPVDVFFRALADAHGSRAVGVILSGTGPNGSAGLKRIKEHGGLALAQIPEEAEYADMPRNAIATGLVDFVLPIAEMLPRILTYFDGLRQSAASTADGADESVREILTMLRVRTGHDFSNYKPPTLLRRIERRANLRGLPTIADYAGVVRQHPDEAVALMKDLLISVTNFFRDAPSWSVLEQHVIPRFFATRTRLDHIRFWVAGCATGEEAYSMAILLAEHAEMMADPPTIQVFGTDLDEHAIAVAREGFYTDAEVADVSEDRLQRFFAKETGGYRLRRELREMLLFAHHNLIKDPPFSHLDLISCRNLLIYLNRSVQERVVETFHFALRPGGILFLGPSESPDGANDLFLRLDRNAHIYERRAVTSRLTLPLADGPASSPRAGSKNAERRPPDRIMPADLHQRLLEQYAPPSLIVTDDYNVVHMSERVTRYLQVPPGEPSSDLLRLIRPELGRDLRTALHQAMRERTRIDVRNVPVRFPEGIRRVAVVVRPVLRESDPARGYFLVVFEEGPAAEEPPEPAQAVDRPSQSATQQLEEELGRVKAQLRTTIEEYETQAEEANAANEELQAMNEELRSAAEELETSKEELQSVNEELTTVNQELKIKIEELGVTNNDFQNFINSTDIATMFLDRALRVKLFTPRVQELFSLLKGDIGRPLTDITSRLRGNRIPEDARTVLNTLQVVEREMQTADGNWHQMRILPYRTTDNRIDGVVVTFQDITARRQAESRVRDSEERLRMLLDSAVDYAIFTVTEDGRVDSWNAGAARMFGYEAEEIIGRSIDQLFTDTDRAAGVPGRELEEARRTGRAVDERYHLRHDGSRLYVSGVTVPLGAGGQGFAKIARDLTAQRELIEQLQNAQTDLEDRVRQRTADLEAQKRNVTELLRRLVSAQEEERARVARDLHDSVGQQITALRLALERHVEALPAGSGAALDEALAVTRNIGRDVDFLAWELRPAALDELGLVAALPRFVAAWAAHTGLVAEFRSTGFKPGQLARDVEVAFYRVTQEALNNVAKHAHATRADVVLSTSDGEVVLIVEDDGIGFDPAATDAHDSLGFVGMRERASLVGARFDVESTPGKGTAVFFRASIESAPAK